MKANSAWHWLFKTLFIMSALACGPNTTEIGDGSATGTTNGIMIAGTGNGIEGQIGFSISKPKGSKGPKRDLIIFILPDTFNPIFELPDTLVPDSQGQFNFYPDTLVKSNIIALDLDSGKAAYIRGFTAKPGERKTAEALFQPVGVISGVLSGIPSDTTFPAVFIPGTPFWALADSNAAYTLSNLPMGRYSIQAQRLRRLITRGPSSILVPSGPPSYPKSVELDEDDREVKVDFILGTF